MDKDVEQLQIRLNQHISDYEMNRVRDEARWEQVLQSQEANAKEIADLTKSTKSLVQAWQATSTIGSFARWLGGFAVIGVAMQWIGDHMK